MVSLKSLYKNLIQEEIRQNYFLYTLNEAVTRGTVDELSGLLGEIGQLINSTNIKSLKTALTLVQADSKKVPRYTDSREAEKIILKIITFYSKIWNFFNQDINKIFDNLGSFHKKDKALNTSNAADFIKRSILRLIIEDNSPWYGKALSTITNDISFANEVPYLNVASFVDEIMSKTREDLSNMMSEAIKINNPSNWHSRISASILASNTGEEAKSTAADASTKTVPIPLTVLRTSSPTAATTASPQTVAARSQRVEMPAFDISTLSPEQRNQLSTQSIPQKVKSPVDTPITPIQATTPRSQRVEMPVVTPAQIAQSAKTQPGFAQLPTEEPGQPVQKIRRRTTTVLETKLSKKLKKR